MLGSEDIRAVARNHSNATLGNVETSGDACNSKPVATQPFSHIHSHCFNCVHTDVCRFKDTTLGAFADMDKILDRINVFATVQCRYYITDEPKQGCTTLSRSCKD